MALTSTRRTIYMVCLLTVVLLVGLHIATAVKGYQYFVDHVEPEGPTRQVTYKTYETRLIMGMIAASITFFTNLLAIMLLFKPQYINMLLNVVVFNLVIEVGMGMITGMSIYEMAITRDFYFFMVKNWDILNKMWDENGFNQFWYMLIADGILTFVPQIAGLIFVYLGVSKQARTGDSGDQITQDSGYSKM